MELKEALQKEVCWECGSSRLICFTDTSDPNAAIQRWICQNCKAECNVTYDVA